MTGNECRMLTEAVLGYHEQIVGIINELTDQYDAMPYRTGEDKRRREKQQERIADYWQKYDALTTIAHRGGLELPPLEVKHTGQRSRELWNNRKPVSGTEEGTFKVEDLGGI